MSLKEMTREQIKDCYYFYMTRHFPEDELKPLEVILRMCDEGQYMCLGLFGDEGKDFQETGVCMESNLGQKAGIICGNDPQENSVNSCPDSIRSLLGYAFVAAPAHCQMTLLDYLAVANACRSKGYGSQILKELGKLQCLGKIPGSGILIETEHEDYVCDEIERSVRLRRNAFYRGNGVKESDLKVSAFGVPFRMWQIPKTEEADIDCMSRNYWNIYVYMCGKEMAVENVVVPL